MLKVIIVVLNLAKLSISLLVERVKFIVESIEGSAYFGTPDPAMADVTIAKQELVDAETNYELNPNKENKKKVKDKKSALKAIMERVRQYVQGVARLNPIFAENIALAAGLSLKGSGGRKKQVAGVMNTAVSGTVAMLAIVFKIPIYNWQMSLTPDDDKSWINIGITSNAEFIKDNLVSGKRYYFRVGNGGPTAKEVFKIVGNTIVL